MNEQGLIRLREFLFKEFNEDELAVLCREIGLNYERLPGEGAFGKTRGMVEAADARDMIPVLMSRVRDLRPTAYRIAAIRRPGPHVTAPAQATAEPAQVGAELAQVAGSPAPVAAEQAQSAGVPATAPAASRSGMRSRLMLVLLVVVLCLAGLAGAVALNQWLLIQRQGAPAVVADVTATGALSAAAVATETATVPLQMSATTLPTAPSSTTVTTAPSATTIPATATSPPTATPQATVPTQTPSPTASPTVSSTPVPSATVTTLVSTANSPEQAVMDANAVLAAYYSGQTGGDSLRAIWVGDTYSFVIAYPAKTLKRNLGVDVTPGQGMTATLRYVQQPAVVSDTGSRTRLTSREYWTYKVGDLVACETVDYSYTLAKPLDQYQIVAYKGDIVSAATGAGCE